MKNKKRPRMGNDYRHLQAKIFMLTILMMLSAIALIFILYSAVLHGRFANFVVGLLDQFIYHDYNMALSVYWYTIRDNMDFFFGAAIFLTFLIILRLYLISFTKYFNEINRGIDALIEEDSGEIVLSPELAATEKKINSIKHTLSQRKLMALAAEQRKNDLVVYLAHDLKTPLTSVIGYLTLLRDEGHISQELREKYLSISLEKAERLEDLINEFFEITRFNLTNLTLEYSKVNLTRLLEQLTYEFKPMLLEKDLSCVLQIEPDTIIQCDVDKMQRVFDNLLRNAINYSFDGSAISIAATKKDGKINLAFSNQGNTIPAEKLNRIFEQFYRLDSARSSKSGGAGLGLAISKEIVELHNGSIKAKSWNEQIVFEVEIPISQEGMEGGKEGHLL